MKTNKSISRIVSASTATNRNLATGSLAMFFGPKVLGELRILMRLASPSAPRQR